MSKSLRLSEKWFRRGLWLVALVFASFLIGLGSTVVSDLPKVEQPLSVEDFMDKAQAQRLRAGIEEARSAEQSAQDALAQARLKHQSAQADSASARESFNNWIATRSSTGRSEQDPEVIERTKQLDALKAAERAALGRYQTQEQTALDARQKAAAEQRALSSMESAAQDQLSAAYRLLELRVFLYRLALTLPLLGIAAWLFVKKRKSTYWPFVWGFIIFAGFAFFVELVPYLPSYGGYVRYIVGIGLTAVIGRYAIQALNRYLERQKEAEQLSSDERRQALGYDLALARWAKSVCPGCERAVDLKNEANDYCAHCGIGLHNRCGQCNTRKSAFAKFCHA